MGLFGFFKKKRSFDNNSDSNQLEEKLSVEMADSAALFVERFSADFEGLDFSIDSLIVVDRILEGIAVHFDKMEEEGQKGLMYSR